MRKLPLQGYFRPVGSPFGAGWEEWSNFSAYVLIASLALYG